MSRIKTLTLRLLLTLYGSISTAMAQAYPSKAVRLVVASSPGAGHQGYQGRFLFLPGSPKPLPVRALNVFSILIHPGLNGTGPDHWHTHWEQTFPDFVRVQQAGWGHPVHDAWAASSHSAST